MTDESLASTAQSGGATVEPPLLRPELLADDVLQTWAPFKGQLRNFVMPPVVADALRARPQDRLVAIPKGPGEGFDDTAHALSLAIAAHQAKAREQLLDYLKATPPASFEILIQILLETLGYEEAAVVGKSGDGGVDVAAVLRLHGMTSVPTVIQVKRWAKPVPATSSASSAAYSGESEAPRRPARRRARAAITTSRFTKEAVIEASAAGKAARRRREARGAPDRERDRRGEEGTQHLAPRPGRAGGRRPRRSGLGPSALGSLGFPIPARLSPEAVRSPWLVRGGASMNPGR